MNKITEKDYLFLLLEKLRKENGAMICSPNVFNKVLGEEYMKIISNIEEQIDRVHDIDNLIDIIEGKDLFGIITFIDSLLWIKEIEFSTDADSIYNRLVNAVDDEFSTVCDLYNFCIGHMQYIDFSKDLNTLFLLSKFMVDLRRYISFKMQKFNLESELIDMCPERVKEMLNRFKINPYHDSSITTLITLSNDKGSFKATKYTKNI